MKNLMIFFDFLCVLDKQGRPGCCVVLKPVQMLGGQQWVAEGQGRGAEGPVGRKPLLPLRLLDRRRKHVSVVVTEGHGY